MLGFYLSLLDTAEEKSDFEELYYNYRDLMYYVANKLLHDTQLAEDAVHDAFIRIANNFSKINAVSGPKTQSFVKTVTRNISIDMIRKRKREVLTELDDMYTTGKIEVNTYDGKDSSSLNGYKFINCSAEEEVLKMYTAEMLAEKLRNMPEVYRDTLTLYYYNDLSVASIAEVLDVSVDAVMKRLQRGRVMLKELVTKDE
jgi:RNA polymerase sigma-70 factor (ECF subfamily)